MTYSRDYREKVLKIKERDHLSFRKAAERFGIGIASGVRWSKDIEPKKTRNKLLI